MRKSKKNTYKFFRFILGPIFLLYYSPKIIGKENIPKTGPLIFVGNHKHVMDQNCVILSNKRPVRFMAKKEYFEGKFAWFFKYTGCISVDRGVKDESAVKIALKELEEGGCVGLFPEGTRNKTDAFLLPFKYGAVSMAKKTKATLVPFGVSGDYKFRSKNLVYIFGKPIKYDDDLDKANKKLEKAIGDLMKEGEKFNKSNSVK